MGSYCKSNFKIIRVTPTVSTDAYAVNDVFFTATEIPNAVIGNGGCSRLLGMYAIDQSSQDFDATFVFSEGNTALGTINATADISDSDIEGLNVTGLAKLDQDQSGTFSAIDNSRIHQVMPSTVTDENSNPVQLLQAADDSTSVYVSGLIVNGTPTFAAADDLDLIFHIEYR